jgi:phosphate transport system substrate-binding protein
MDAVAKTLGVNWAPGVDKSVHWKESIAGQGNDGVAALIQLTPGAIGYIEYGYAQLAHLPMAALENKSHRYVTPDQDGIAGAKALEGAIIPEDLQIRVPDPKASDAYAIVTYTWLLLRKKYRTTKEAETLKDLLRFSLDDHQQQTAQQLGYLRVPGDVVAKMKDELETIAVEN